MVSNSWGGGCREGAVCKFQLILFSSLLTVQWEGQQGTAHSRHLMLKTSNLPWPSEVSIGFLHPCRPPHAMVAQEKGFCLYSPHPLSKMSPLEALTVTAHRWLVGKWGKQEPCPHFLPRGRGLRSYQAQAAGGPEVLWLVGKELLAPWPPIP